MNNREQTAIQIVNAEETKTNSLACCAAARASSPFSSILPLHGKYFYWLKPKSRSGNSIGASRVSMYKSETTHPDAALSQNDTMDLSTVREATETALSTTDQLDMRHPMYIEPSSMTA